MEKYLLSVNAGTHFEEPGAHLKLDSVVYLGLHVDEKTNQYVTVISTPHLLMNPLWALQNGLVCELYGDATHKMSHHLIKLSAVSSERTLRMGSEHS